VTRCDDVRTLFSAYLEGGLADAEIARVEEHVAACSSCSGLLEALRTVLAAGADLEGLEPPQAVASAVSASPCAHWLTLLYRAVDHELVPEALATLLNHLEACESCRAAWDDIALIRQVGSALEPPAQLVAKCRTAPFRRFRTPRRVMGVRTATAAAYLLAIATTLMVGNPVTLARNEAGNVFEKAQTAVHHSLKQLASDGKGELRVMIWRFWQWGERQVQATRDLLRGEDDHQNATEKTTPEQGGSS